MDSTKIEGAQAPPHPKQPERRMGLVHNQHAERVEIEHQIIDSTEIERRAQTLAGRAVGYLNRAPSAAKLLAAELALAMATHPHIRFVRGGLMALALAMAYDWYKREHAKPQDGGKAGGSK